MSLVSQVQLNEDENMIVIVRRYWVAFVWPATVAFLLLLLPFFFLFPLFQFSGGVFIFLALIIVALWRIARLAVIWYFNAFSITNRRIIDIDQKGLFDRTVSEAALEKIQDVSYRKKGILQTLFRYGTIEIQTAGTTANLEIRYVKDPEKIHKEITDIYQERVKITRKQETETKAKSTIAQIYHDLGEEKFDSIVDQVSDNDQS